MADQDLPNCRGFYVLDHLAVHCGQADGEVLRPVYRYIPDSRQRPETPEGTEVPILDDKKLDDAEKREEENKEKEKQK